MTPGTAVQPGAPFLERITRLADEPPFVVAIADLDNFAEYNASAGREAGDEILRVTEENLIAELPEPSLLTPLGGDAWMVALPGASPEEALLTLDAARRCIEPVRMSIGIAGFPDHTDDPEELPGLADEALARAKRDRGNRVAIYVEEKMVLKSNYYPRGQLERLAALAKRLERTEASLLREALGNTLDSYRDVL